VKQTKKLLFGRTLLIAFIITITITILLVFLTGLSSHRSILSNSLISLAILSACLFIFLVFGLYNGLNVYDNYSHKLQLSWRRAKKRLPDSWASGFTGDTDIPDIGDGIGGVILAIILWIVISIALVFLLIFLQAVVWLTLILLAIAIYWIIIRAFKLIFSNSSVCENDLPKSISYAFFYTLLYAGWIYGIIYIASIF
jgi:hypothetical protein